MKMKFSRSRIELSSSVSSWCQISAVPSAVLMSAFHSRKKWNHLPVFLLLQGILMGSHQRDLFPPRCQTELPLSCRMKFLSTEEKKSSAAHVISTLQRDCLDVIQRNSSLMLEGLMALIQPPSTFTGWATCSHSQSFRFRKDLAALACKDEICRVQKNQVPAARYPLTPLSCRALPSVSASRSLTCISTER